MYRNNKGSLKIDKRKSSSMISRDAFLERINQEGFSFSIDIPRRNFSDFTSLVRRRRISEEDLYQLSRTRKLFERSRGETTLALQ